MSVPDHANAPILSISGRDAFRIGVCVLHAAGAVVATVFCFMCDAQKSKQIATVPFALPLSVSPIRNMSHARASRTGFPWGEDNAEGYHSWNPFLLVLVFEWLTAGFALCNLNRLIPNIMWPAIAWLVAGLAVVISWLAVNASTLDPIMPFLVIASFTVSAILFIRFDRLRFHMASQNAPPPVTPLVQTMMDGRVWMVPKSIGGLKLRTRPIFKQEPQMAPEQQEYERVSGILNRYAEYCVTAPLLFIAVTCLLVPDAPSWYAHRLARVSSSLSSDSPTNRRLFITGYMFLVGCNLFGVILHYTTMYMYQSGANKKRDDNTTDGVNWWGYMFNLIYTGTWRSPHPKRLYLLSAAWLSLLLPMSGLVYMTRGYLFSGDLPTLVSVMIWNLFLTYSLFGILPTFTYVFWTGFDRLDLILDVLNVAAKFPIPMQILYGYIARPAGVHPCFS